jgi:histidine phosphotransferase ChpT
MGTLDLAAHGDATMRAEALQVANSAAGVLGRKLRLLRAAWVGSAALDVAQLQTLAEGLPARGLRLDWNGFDPNLRFAPDAARLILNVLLLGAESLPEGGLLTLSGNPPDEMLVTIAGSRAAWPAGLAGFLHDEASAWAAVLEADVTVSARALQAPITTLIAHAAGLHLSLLLSAKTESCPPLLLGLGHG